MKPFNVNDEISALQCSLLMGNKCISGNKIVSNVGNKYIRQTWPVEGLTGRSVLCPMPALEKEPGSRSTESPSEKAQGMDHGPALKAGAEMVSLRLWVTAMSQSFSMTDDFKSLSINPDPEHTHPP